jgi:hypothetical protein
MKNLKIVFLICTLYSFVAVSCGGDNEKQLVKSWQVSDIETSTDLPDSIKQQMIAGSQMIFTKDGKYTSSGGIGVDQGTYTLDKDNKNLSTISAAGRNNSVYTIEKLSDDKLVLTTNGNTVTLTAKK